MRRLALALAVVVVVRLAWRQKRVRKATYGSILWVVARVTPDMFDRAIVANARRMGRDEAELRALLARHRILQEKR